MVVFRWLPDTFSCYSVHGSSHPNEYCGRDVLTEVGYDGQLTVVIHWCCDAVTCPCIFNCTLYLCIKSVQFIETLCKGDTVIRDIKQQMSIFHHYKISNFTITRSQKNPSDNVKLWSWKFCNGEKFILLFYISNNNVILPECFYKLNSFLHKYLLFYCRLKA